MLAFKTSVDTLIDASRQTIFDLVGDVSRHSELAGSGEVLRTRVLTPGSVRLGTRFEADEDIPMGRQHPVSAMCGRSERGAAPSASHFCA